ncbi:MAG: aminobutyraldehyde dehydrogenase [Spirochaetales bacterium]|nr:aminobutyraldehyde dehydrogenase [Spirochaetales bacterium]
MKENYDLWINGKWEASETKDRIEVVNPATGKVFASVADASTADFKKAIDAAEKAYYEGPWGKSTPAERSKIIWKLADLLEAHADEFAEVETMNTGKPLETQCKPVDVHDSVDNFKFYSTLARDTHGIVAGEYVEGITHVFRHEPVGVVGQITPWNYPLQMAVWKIGPALAAGCTIIIKPASNTPLTTLMLGEIAKEAGLPDGVLNIVTGRGAKGEILATDSSVRLISLTGSSGTGKRLMELASSTVKRVHLELGGKAPVVVFKDADLQKAADIITLGATFNSGQDCTAATRIYVEEGAYDELTKLVVKSFEAVKVGDPLKSDTDMGSLISKSQLERVSGFVERAVKDGAKVLTGGKQLTEFGDGYFYAPTVIVDAAQDSEIMQQEVFGPVITISTFKDEADAIKLGNDVIYGLAASVWSSDIGKAMRVSHALEFGTVWINNHLAVASEAPHGGFKQSGFGKELSLEAVKEYQITKNIAITTEA